MISFYSALFAFHWCGIRLSYTILNLLMCRTTRFNFFHFIWCDIAGMLHPLTFQFLTFPLPFLPTGVYRAAGDADPPGPGPTVPQPRLSVRCVWVPEAVAAGAGVCRAVRLQGANGEDHHDHPGCGHPALPHAEHQRGCLRYATPLYKCFVMLTFVLSTLSKFSNCNQFWYLYCWKCFAI